MVAIEATEQEVSEAIAGKEAELSIAAINGPSAVVISGKEEAAEQIASHFQGKGKKTKRLAVSHAFHSPLMEPMLAEFQELAQSLTYQEPQIPILSNTSGELLSTEQAQDPAYWVAHVREPVRFAAAIESLAEPRHHHLPRARPRPGAYGNGPAVLGRGDEGHLCSHPARGTRGGPES